MGKKAKKGAESTVEMSEVKVSVPEREIARAVAAFGLRMANAVARDIYFFDTPDFALSAQGVILRARKFSGQPDDCTVKLRPIKREAIGADWLSQKGLKIETDIMSDRIADSCSLTRVPERGSLEQLVMGEGGLDALFFPDQHRFLLEHNPIQIDWSRLTSFGPVMARCWKTVDSESSRELTLELWRLPNGRKTLELSVKGPREEREALQRVLDSFLAGAGFRAARDGDTKTRLTMRYFKGEPGAGTAEEPPAAAPASSEEVKQVPATEPIQDAVVDTPKVKSGPEKPARGRPRKVLPPVSKESVVKRPSRRASAARRSVSSPPTPAKSVHSSDMGTASNASKGSADASPAVEPASGR